MKNTLEAQVLNLTGEVRERDAEIAELKSIIYQAKDDTKKHLQTLDKFVKLKEAAQLQRQLHQEKKIDLLQKVKNL